MNEIFDFPQLPVSRCLFVPQFNTKMNRSSFNGFEHIVENPGERWIVSYKFSVLTFEECKVLKAHSLTCAALLIKRVCSTQPLINKADCGQAFLE